MSFYSRVKSIEPSFYYISVTVFITRVVFFSTIPFLAIFLRAKVNLTPGIIGMILMMAPLGYGITSFYNGFLCDKFNYKNLIIASTFIGGISLFFLLKFYYPLWIACWYFILGITRSVFNVASKTMSIHYLGISNARFTLSIRYIIINFAASIGPFIGVYFIDHHSRIIFDMAALIFLTLGLFWCCQTSPKKKSSTRFNFIDILFTFIKNKRLLIIILINILFNLVFSQFDSIIPQHLYTTFNNGISLYAIMISINAILCITLQIPLVKFGGHIYKPLQGVLASIFLGLGFLGFNFSTNLLGLAICTILISLGEIIFVTLTDLMLIEVASVELIGTYLGASNFGMLGTALAPLLGGWLYQFTNFYILNWFCVSIAISIIFLYIYLFNVR
jgi:MFS family permease